MANAEFSPNPEIRATRLANARIIAIVLTALAAMLCVSIFLLPDRLRDTYLALVTALTMLPLLAVILVGISKGLYAMKLRPRGFFINPEDFKKGAAPNLAGVCCLPISALIFLAVRHTGYIFDWWSTTQLVLAGGVAPALAMQWARNWFWISLPALTIVLAAIWGGSTAVLGNSILDESATDVFRTHVTAKHMTAGQHPSYHLTIAPWGPKSEPDDISVTGVLYLSLSTGQEICVDLHPGAFGVRWYEIAFCH